MRVLADQFGAGPPVVLLHGQPGSAADWSNVVPLLAADHLVITPDRPGYGRTAGTAVGFAGNADAVVDLLDRYELAQATFVGHSWGGGVALAAAIRHPDRVSGLVLAASVRPGERLGWDDKMLAAPILGEALAALTLGATGRVLGSRKVQTLVDRRFDRRAREAVTALSGLTGARTGAPVWRSFVTEQRFLFSELGGLAAGVGGIRAPTVVVSGGADRTVPAAVGARLAESIPGATHRVLPDARHLLPFDNPDSIADAVREVATR